MLYGDKIQNEKPQVSGAFIICNTLHIIPKFCPLMSFTYELLYHSRLPVYNMFLFVSALLIDIVVRDIVFVLAIMVGAHLGEARVNDLK